MNFKSENQVTNSIITNPDVSSSQAVPMLVQTTPPMVSFHRIEDTQLNNLMNINSPIPFGISTTAAGGMLGLIPTIAPIIKKLKDSNAVDALDVIYLIVSTVCIICALIFGWLSFSGMKKAKAALQEIRNRPSTPM